MSKTLCGLLLSAGVLMVGCGKESPPGGPGAESNKGDGDQNQVDEERAFRVVVPGTSVNLARGATENVTIELDKGDQFQQKVTLEFDLPEGVSVTPEEPAIPADQNELEVSLQASRDAPAGEKKVTVTARPETGQTTSQSFTIEIEPAAENEKEK